MISKVTGDGLQLISIRGGMVFVQAMVHVIVDQGPLGVHHRLLDRMKLLRDLEAGLAVLDHADHGPQMTVGAFQPSDHGGMGCVDMGLCHRRTVSPLGG